MKTVALPVVVNLDDLPDTPDEARPCTSTNGWCGAMDTGPMDTDGRWLCAHVCVECMQSFMLDVRVDHRRCPACRAGSGWSVVNKEHHWVTWFENGGAWA